MPVAISGTRNQPSVSATPPTTTVRLLHRLRVDHQHGEPAERDGPGERDCSAAEDHGDAAAACCAAACWRARGTAGSGATATTRAPPLSAGRRRGRGSDPRAWRSPAPRRPCPRPARGRAPRSRRDRTCAAPDPSSDSTRRPCRPRARSLRRMSRMFAADTGSTDSNGSSSTSDARRVDQRAGERDLLGHAGRVVATSVPALASRSSSCSRSAVRSAITSRDRARTAAR